MKSALAALLALSWVARGEPPMVAIQPLGNVPDPVLREAAAGVRAVYDAKVVVQPAIPLPRAAWYGPRSRYKAVETTEFLEKETPGLFQKVVGVTAADISATKDDGSDWGIMGLGQLGGRACVISTFRLGKPPLLAGRLRKVLNHELGHTFGVDHCPAAGCLMQDKRGKIATVDAESGRPCAKCAE